MKKVKRKHGLTPIQRIERRRFFNGSCWETSYTPNKPYPLIKIDGRHHTVHRIAYEAYVGPIPKGLFVCHICDNTRCHNPDHLFIGTASDNMRDMVSKKRNYTKPIDTSYDDRLRKLSTTNTQKQMAADIGKSQAFVSKRLIALGLARGKTTSFGKNHGKGGWPKGKKKREYSK